jgi:hypothetical protein
MISRPVQEELDRLKGDGNSRRAKRARSANAIIREILSTEGLRLTLESAEFTVQLTFPPDYRKADLVDVGDWVDLTRPDHEIVATAIHYKDLNPADQVYFLTNDTLPMLTAKRCALKTRMIPEDWQLPSEPDERDKRIKALEQKLVTFERRQPVVEVVSAITLKNIGPENSITIGNLEEVSVEDVSSLLAFFTERYPVETEFPRTEADLPTAQRRLARMGSLGSFTKYYPPSESEIAEYKNVKYPKWKSDVEKWILKTQHSLIETHRYIPLSFEISNSGEVPLINAVVEFFAYDGVSFCPPDTAESLDEMLKLPEFPMPPSPPRGDWANISSVAGRIASLMPNIDTLSTIASWPMVSPMPNRRDKHAFYWKGRRPSDFATEWAFECEEFRHKVEAEPFSIYIYFPVGSSPESVSVKCRVTGANMSSPFTSATMLKLAYQEQKAIEIIGRIARETK